MRGVKGPNDAVPEKAMASKDKILDSAEALFVSEGYERATIRDIASAAGFDSGGIYYYFRNKEELLFEVIRRRMSALVSSAIDLTDEKGDPAQQLKAYIDSTIAKFLGGSRTFAASFEGDSKSLTTDHREQLVQLRDQYQAILIGIIQRGQQRGIFTAPVDAKIAAYNILSIMVRAGLWYSPKGRLTIRQLADDLFTFVAGGLGMRQAIEVPTESHW